MIATAKVWAMARTVVPVLALAWAFLFALFAGGQPAVAQDWAMSQFDDGSYFSATLAPIDGPGPALVCGERSPQMVSPRITGNSMPDITPAAAFRLYLSDRVVGAPEPQRQTRDDVMIVAGGAGYRLRGLRWNDAFSTWQIDLPATDPSLRAIAATPGFEIRQDGGGGRYSSLGFTKGLAQLSAYCQGMFAAIGKPWPVNATTGLAGQSMRQLAEAGIRAGCGGAARWTPEAILPAQVDGDGIEDIVVDWRAVTCATGIPHPNCGAANCLVEVYVSALYPRVGAPESILAPGVRLQPLDNGNDAVAFAGSLGGCAQAIGRGACEFLSYWNGAALVPLR